MTAQVEVTVGQNVAARSYTAEPTEVQGTNASQHLSIKLKISVDAVLRQAKETYQACITDTAGLDGTEAMPT